jgi:hypothetical protein
MDPKARAPTIAQGKPTNWAAAGVIVAHMDFVGLCRD